MQAVDVDAVLNIPLSSYNEDDSWAWHYEKSGCFTVRSAYRLIMETKRRRVDWLEHNASSSNIVL